MCELLSYAVPHPFRHIWTKSNGHAGVQTRLDLRIRPSGDGQRHFPLQYFQMARYELKMDTYQKLEQRFRQVSHLKNLNEIASWDEAVIMPAGSGPYRNQGLAELGTVIQTLISHPEVGDWLNEARPTSEWTRANLREMKRIHHENTAVPVDLQQRLIIARMNCEQRWRVMRGDNDWSGLLPHLQEVLNLTREQMRAIGGAQPLYDTALSQYSPGLSTKTVETLFTELKSFLPDLTERIVGKQREEKCIQPEGHFPMAAQKQIGLELMGAIGFNFNNGRLDESHHPFCGGYARDVRITTRYDENEFSSSLMGILHETGHALYDQHLPETWINQPVGAACGMSIHESQSLLMEMQICRGREFLQFAGPRIRKHLGPYTKNQESLTDENLARLTSRVRPGLIRVDADEVTYPWHIILRFEIERDLLEDRWSLSELPNVWNEKMQTYLGHSTLGNDRDGCMQDVHWPAASFGYFPAYTLGAVIAAQLFARMNEDLPSLRQDLAIGDFKPVRDWLNKKIWSQGSRLNTMDLVENAAGALNTKDFRQHLTDRYLG